MSSVLKNMVTKVQVDPFSGRVIGEPTTLVEHVPADFDSTEVPKGVTIDTIMTWVDGSSERARAAQIAELGRPEGARPTLLARLEQI